MALTAFGGVFCKTEHNCWGIGGRWYVCMCVGGDSHPPFAKARKEMHGDWQKNKGYLNLPPSTMSGKVSPLPIWVGTEIPHLDGKMALPTLAIGLPVRYQRQACIPPHEWGHLTQPSFCTATLRTSLSLPAALLTVQRSLSIAPPSCL